MAEPKPRKRASRSQKGSPFTLPEPEIVVVTDPRAGVAVGTAGLEATNADTAHMNEALRGDAEFEQTFGLDASRMRRRQDEMPPGTVPDLASFISVRNVSGDLDAIAAELASDPAVLGAYVKPPAEPPIAPAQAGEELEAPAPGLTPPATADFTGRQGYLDAAPDGVDARWAWTRPGGRGANVRVIDIEGAWRFTHEDLLQNQGGVIGGTESTDVAWRNHGTAVVGEIGGDVNSFGITGIAPDAAVRAISIFGGMGSAGAIRTAADALSSGDIILIELHRPGPRHNFANRNDQAGYIALEWWPDDWAAIRYAIGRGVVVVEAAGNGAENLDDALYDTPAAGFPSSWSNPFRGGVRDSGAIVVGAGAPPQGTHGRDHGPARSRLGFSNFGARVDVQGWGREVTSTGYGGLQSGSEDVWYTDTFSGTSSASPIVVGAAACYQGISHASGARKTPDQIRTRLHSTGSAQQDAPNRPATQRIGNLPDLRAMVGVKAKAEIKEFQKEKLEVKEFKEHQGEKFRAKDKEIKEVKERKLEVKEFQKEFMIENKNLRDIVLRKEVVERKLTEFQQLVGRQLMRGGAGGAAPTEASTEDRLAALETAVGEVVHFISVELRPDLGAGALSYDETELEQQAAASKQEKDLKDQEKLPEG
jgi:hypothetical protein